MKHFYFSPTARLPMRFTARIDGEVQEYTATWHGYRKPIGDEVYLGVGELLDVEVTVALTTDYYWFMGWGWNIVWVLFLWMLIANLLFVSTGKSLALFVGIV